VRIVEAAQRAERRFAIQAGGVLDDLGLRAEAREHRHLARERGAQRVDGLDAQAVRHFRGVRQFLEDALAHFGRGLARKGDG
jgi:hypothetical protein